MLLVLLAFTKFKAIFSSTLQDVITSIVTMIKKDATNNFIYLIIQKTKIEIPLVDLRDNLKFYSWEILLIPFFVIAQIFPFLSSKISNTILSISPLEME